VQCLVFEPAAVQVAWVTTHSPHEVHWAGTELDELTMTLADDDDETTVTLEPALKKSIVS